MDWATFWYIKVKNNKMLFKGLGHHAPLISNSVYLLSSII